ncbi:MAG: DUF721 domain-containing protein [Chlamydiia bacterium]|nr:DUF721 domain-containing protein [Chlamydiia bacterium]
MSFAIGSKKLERFFMAKRVPRNYNGTHNPAKQIRDLLPEFLSALGRKTGDVRQEVFAYWQELLGETLAPMTEPISLIEGVLTVKVKSSTLYSVLCQHERPRLLKQLQERYSVQKIVFRV